MTEAFFFYDSYNKVLQKIPKKYQLTFVQAIIDFGLYGVKPDFCEKVPQSVAFSLDLAFTQIAANIQAGKNRYQAAVENGKKGGRPSKNGKNSEKKGPKKPEQKPEPKPEVKPEPKPEKNHNKNDNDKLKVYHCHDKPFYPSCQTDGVGTPPSVPPDDGETGESMIETTRALILERGRENRERAREEQERQFDRRASECEAERERREDIKRRLKEIQANGGSKSTT